VRAALAAWPPDAGALLATPAIDPLLRVAGAHAGLPDTERSQLFGAVVEALEAAQAPPPLQLVLDDQHWADEASLLLLRRILRAPLERVLVVVTYRDTELSRGHPMAALLADYRREPFVHRVALHGLDASDVRELLGGGGDAIERLVARITDETEGNPFFVTEVIRHLVEQGRLRRTESGVDVVGVLDSIDVPEGIREVVGRRLTRLSPSCNELLTVASVIGRHFPARLLAEVAELPLDATLDAVDEAMQAGIVVADDTGVAAFAFSHALVRETLFGEVSTIRRMRLHLRIGTELAAQGVAVAEVAHHLIEAGPVGDDRVMGEAAVAAANDARYRLAAFEDAAGICRRALAVLGEEHRDLRCDLLTILGDSTVAAADINGIELLREATEMARRLRDAVRIARAVTYALRAGVPTPSIPPFVEAAGDALSLLPADEAIVRTRLRAVLALSGNSGDRVTGDALTAEVLAEAERVGDAEAITYASLARADVLLGRGELDEVDAVLARGFAVIGDALTEALLPFGSRVFERELIGGDRAAAQRAMQTMAENSERFDSDVWSPALPAAAFAFLDGRLDDARDLTVSATTGGRMSVLQATALLGVISFERGEATQLLPLLEAEARRTGLAAWRAGLAAFLVDADRLDEARPWTVGVLEQLDREVGGTAGLALIAEAAFGLGDEALARQAFELFERYAGRSVASGVLCLGATDRYRALCAATMGDHETALGLLDAADEHNARIESALHLAHAQVDRAIVLLDRGADGDADRAATLLRHASDDAERLDLARVRRRIERARTRP
jgi:hypothetical protein